MSERTPIEPRVLREADEFRVNASYKLYFGQEIEKSSKFQRLRAIFSSRRKNSIKERLKVWENTYKGD